MTLIEKPFEIIAGQGENAGNQHFLLFPQCFLLAPKRISAVKFPLFCRLYMLSIRTSLKNLSFGRVNEESSRRNYGKKEEYW